MGPGILERGIILQLGIVMDYYLNLRPVKLFPGVRGVLADSGPREIDRAVCREGTEGHEVDDHGSQVMPAPRWRETRSCVAPSSAAAVELSP